MSDLRGWVQVVLKGEKNLPLAFIKCGKQGRRGNGEGGWDLLLKHRKRNRWLAEGEGVAVRTISVSSPH